MKALLLLDVVEILRSEDIEYAVIGAFALSVHDVIRATTGVDALLFTTQARLAKLGGQFEDAGFVTQFRRGDSSDPIPGMLILGDSHGNHVELLSGLRGMDVLDLMRRVTRRFGREAADHLEQIVAEHNLER